MHGDCTSQGCLCHPCYTGVSCNIVGEYFMAIGKCRPGDFQKWKFSLFRQRHVLWISFGTVEVTHRVANVLSKLVSMPFIFYRINCKYGIALRVTKCFLYEGFSPSVRNTKNCVFYWRINANNFPKKPDLFIRQSVQH